MTNAQELSLGGGPLFFALSGLFITASGAMFARAAFPASSRAVRVAGAFLFAYSSLIAISTLLGATGHLARKPFLLASIVLLAAGSASHYFSNRRTGMESNALVNTEENLSPLSLLLITFAGFSAGIVMFWGFVAPPPPWDGYVYHLPFAATWMQNGRISLVTVPFGDQAGTYFPSNTELYFSWLMLAFRSEVLTNAAQFPFYVCIGLIVYLIGRELGFDRDSSACSGAIALFIPGMMHQAVASEVDVVFASLFLLSLFFILHNANNGFGIAGAASAGLAAGLLAGTKYIGLLFSAIIVIPAIILYIKNKKPGALIVFIAAAFSMCCFWFLRNWAATGNPMFPLTLNLFGIEIFPGGYTKASMYYSVFHSSSARAWLSSMVVTSGVPLGLLFGAFAVAAPASAILSSKRQFTRAAVLSIPILIFAICAFAIPYNLESRFTYSAWAIASLGAAMFTGSQNTAVQTISRALLAAAVGASIASDPFIKSTAMSVASIFIPAVTPGGDFFVKLRPACIVVVLAAASFAAGAAIYLKYNKAAMKVAGLALAAAAFPLIAYATLLLLPSYRAYRLASDQSFTLGAAWRAVDSLQQHNGPTPLNIAFTGTDLSFGLYGAFLQNRVYSVPVNSHRDWKFHDCVKWLKSSGNYSTPKTDRIDFCRRDPDPDAWVANLAAAGTDLVLVSVLHQNDLPHLWHDAHGFPIELSWALSRPGTFRPIYANRHVYVFAFNGNISTR